MHAVLLSILSLALPLVICQNCDNSKKDASLPKAKFPVRLVGGEGSSEGNVEIKHNGEWAGVCDDDWGIADATVVCKQLGFKRGAIRSTTDAFFGQGKASRQTVVWMDNVACTGHEAELADCKSNGWAKHDCTRMEVAGVVCKNNLPKCQSKKRRPKKQPKKPIKELFSTPAELKFAGGRNEFEGRILVYAGGPRPMGEICGVKWSLREAMVVCKQMGLGFAQQAVTTDFYGTAPSRNSSQLPIVLSGVRCTGKEESLNECKADPTDRIHCQSSGRGRSVAGAVCTNRMADLTPDIKVLQSSVYLSDVPMLYLQCAMEEDCLASTVKNEVAPGYGWLTHMRRLLRFSSRIHNIGGEDFRPHADKTTWDWHQCHMHYHSMEEFSHYDIIDDNGVKQAEGHKASFCLEDNGCAYGYYKRYACANFGDQGISPGCYDEYKHDIDCQWIDISDLKPGQYTFVLKINPNYRVPEMNYTNNAVQCDLYYSLTTASVSNCFHRDP